MKLLPYNKQNSIIDQRSVIKSSDKDKQWWVDLAADFALVVIIEALACLPTKLNKKITQNRHFKFAWYMSFSEQGS